MDIDEPTVGEMIEAAVETFGIDPPCAHQDCPAPATQVHGFLPYLIPTCDAHAAGAQAALFDLLRAEEAGGPIEI